MNFSSFIFNGVDSICNNDTTMCAATHFAFPLVLHLSIYLSIYPHQEKEGKKEIPPKYLKIQTMAIDQLDAEKSGEQKL
jgi:hypothetical protein